MPELAPVMMTTLSLISIQGNYTRGLSAKTEGKKLQLAQQRTGPYWPGSSAFSLKRKVISQALSSYLLRMR
jgi:hypothetical protein